MTMKKILFTALLCAISLTAMAQGKRISGTVSDNMGPVMMANVVERDANNRIVSATQTDFNGNFALQVKNPKNKLVVTYVGSKTYAVTIGEKSVFNITLQSEQTQLKEVTVTSRRQSAGGLMIPKKELSGASQTFNMEAVEGLAFTSADEALQGEIAGLDIVANSGNLGAGTQMRLRGVTTINGDANPLIVVDDIIFDNPNADFDFANANEEDYAALLSVNVDDIANIEVRKDAALVVEYGSRASNGVILITKKRGVRGKARVGFSYKLSGTWQPEGYNLLDGDGYTMLMKEAFYNPSQAANATTNINELNYNKSWAEYENWNNNTDWVKEVTKFGPQHEFNFNISGGGEKAQFRMSAGYKNQEGSVIQQKFEQFTTNLSLDYNVSDRIRFSASFPLTYNNNLKNYSGLLGIAQKLAPNMAIYRQNADGSDTDEFYLMNPSGDPNLGNYSSDELKKIRELGNPIAIANLAWGKDQNYRITPNFLVKYELLGVETGKHRLTFNGRVDFDIFAQSKPTYAAAGLTTLSDYNSSRTSSDNEEFNRFKIGARAELVFNPHFNNEDINMGMLVRYDMGTQKTNSQKIGLSNLPGNITSPTIDALLSSMSSSNGRSAWQSAYTTVHFGYKERYVVDFRLSLNGDSKFGPKNKWAYFPGVSVRYNVSDEPFMKWTKSFVSVLGLKASYGITGNAPSQDYLFYNTYNTSAGNYGFQGQTTPVAKLDGLKLDDLRWEKTSELNLGFELNLFDDKVNIDFNYYDKNTKDMLMPNIRIPSMTGYTTLSNANVGEMSNRGWELYVNANNIIKVGKFSFSAGFNIAQNENLIEAMDETVLESLNTDWAAATRGGNSYLNRIQVGNALGSMYGFRYKGVYQYTYDYLQNYQKENNLTPEQYENWINDEFLASGKTAPIVIGSNGKVQMTSKGEPMHMVYNYSDGSSTYTFQGGDAMYEDINHDGQINALDVVYLGNSLPKVNGGFNFTFKYGNFTLKPRFMYRFGNKVINEARMELEKMFDTYNQSSTVNYRWRKDGDVTPMPRAMYNSGYNFQGSDRYVEDGSFVRLQNIQVSYNFPNKSIKKLGLTRLQLYFSMNNLYCWTKYSGVDPEVSAKGFGLARDGSQTPRSKSFTASINVGF